MRARTNLHFVRSRPSREHLTGFCLPIPDSRVLTCTAGTDGCTAACLPGDPLHLEEGILAKSMLPMEENFTQTKTEVPQRDE